MSVTMSNGKTRSELNYEARVQIATAYRACNNYNLNQGILNHVTLRAPAMDREGDIMLVIPYGLLWTEATASRMLGVDFDTGEVVEGKGNVAKQVNAIHRAIHRTRHPVDGTTCIMHTHQPYTTALACVDDPEPLKFSLHQSMMMFYGKVAYDYNYCGLATSEAEGYRLAEALGEKSVLLMGHHGVMVVGKRASDAFRLLFFLESASTNQWLVQSSGMKMRSAPLDIVKKIAGPRPPGEDHNQLFFDALTRKFTDQKPCIMD